MVNHQLSLLYSYYSFRSLVPFRFLIVYLALIMVLRLPAFLEKLIAGLKEREAGMRYYTDFTLLSVSPGFHKNNTAPAYQNFNTSSCLGWNSRKDATKSKKKSKVTNRFSFDMTRWFHIFRTTPKYHLYATSKQLKGIPPQYVIKFRKCLGI